MKYRRCGNKQKDNKEPIKKEVITNHYTISIDNHRDKSENFTNKESNKTGVFQEMFKRINSMLEDLYVREVYVTHKEERVFYNESETQSQDKKNSKELKEYIPLLKDLAEKLNCAVELAQEPEEWDEIYEVCELLCNIADDNSMFKRD